MTAAILIDVPDFDELVFLDEDDPRAYLAPPLGTTGVVIGCVALPLSLACFLGLLRWISMYKGH